jgi:hypothetical protein
MCLFALGIEHPLDMTITGSGGIARCGDILPMSAMFFGGCAETIMIRNGLYSLIAVGIGRGR